MESYRSRYGVSQEAFDRKLQAWRNFGRQEAQKRSYDKLVRMLEDENSRTRDMLGVAQERVSILRNKNEYLHGENESLDGENEYLTALNEELHTALRANSSNLAKEQEEKANLENHLTAMRRDLDFVADKLQEKSYALAHFQSENNELKRQLALLEDFKGAALVEAIDDDKDTIEDETNEDEATEALFDFEEINMV